MFANNKPFNNPLNLDTSRLETIAGAFLNAISFNQSLQEWDTAKVKDMRSLFFNATTYQEALCWELNRAVQVDDMFCGSLGSFNESCVTLIGLVDKTLEDCGKFREDDEPEGSSSGSRVLQSAAGFGGSLVLAGSLFFI